MKRSSRSIKVPRILVSLCLAAAAVVVLQSSRTVSSQRRPTTIRTSTSATDLVKSKTAPGVLAEVANGGTASVIVFLSDQADLSAANDIKDQDERGWYVYNTLKTRADLSQAPIKKLLDSQGVRYLFFWAANMLVVDADQKLVDQLAARFDIARIDSNDPVRWIEDPIIANKSDATFQNLVATTEWGVDNVNAPAVWALGFKGQGIVVGDLDTGTRWTHDALKSHYRGWNGSTADHNYNWHDAIHSGGGICGADTMAPCDDSGHGTHTAGTIVGDDGSGNQIGVAPGARWIGCRNMDQGVGTPARYTECFQFMIAPTDLNGANPTPALRPHVINNSWTCPASEGCTTRAELETIVNNTQAAGIFVEASAGNSGPGCSTVADAPAIYSGSFSTGAIDINNDLASFSSRGPSTFYTPNLLKPNISAPGVNVRSSYSTSDTTYVNLSGTSMAGPHVVGVVALLWSARPQLIRDIAATKNVLQNTANPNVTVAAETCGGTPSTIIPNNSFGYGRVDALAAVNSLPGTTAAAVSIGGRVLTRDGSGIRGAMVAIIDPNGTVKRTMTNAFGYYRFDSVAAGSTYIVRAAARRYTFAPRTIGVTDQFTDLNFIDGQ
jgi:serine protease AprX